MFDNHQVSGEWQHGLAMGNYYRRLHEPTNVSLLLVFEWHFALAASRADHRFTATCVRVALRPGGFTSRPTFHRYLCSSGTSPWRLHEPTTVSPLLVFEWHFALAASRADHRFTATCVRVALRPGGFTSRPTFHRCLCSSGTSPWRLHEPTNASPLYLCSSGTSPWRLHEPTNVSPQWCKTEKLAMLCAGVNRTFMSDPFRRIDWEKLGLEKLATSCGYGSVEIACARGHTTYCSCSSRRRRTFLVVLVKAYVTRCTWQSDSPKP